MKISGGTSHRFFRWTIWDVFPSQLFQLIKDAFGKNTGGISAHSDWLFALKHYVRWLVFRVQRAIFTFLSCFSCLHFDLLYRLYYKKKLYRFTALLDLEDTFIIISNLIFEKIFCKELFKIDSLNIFINIKVSFHTFLVEKSKYNTFTEFSSFFWDDNTKVY